ncbi:Hypothetical_protein [Hexamita inflata]|uniref:Hypothetical_protein n=1 Tax=Hexamita inflata TaxID=28002 RepID=A0AA86QYM8_9EUKA|nr:Hypothetical protein HINF_LOCUS53367 [Hexamita inflata]
MKNNRFTLQKRVLSLPLMQLKPKPTISPAPSLQSCKVPTKIKCEVKPLIPAPAPIHQPLNIDEINLSNFTFEMNSARMKQVLLGFIDNVTVDVNKIEAENKVRASIQGIRIRIERLEHLILEANSLQNSMETLCAKQIAMIIQLKGM